MKIKTSLALLSAFLGSFTLFAQTQTNLNTQPPSYSFSATISGGTLRLYPTDGLGVDTNKVIISGNGVLDLGNIPLSTGTNISGSATNVSNETLVTEYLRLNISTNAENILSSTNVIQGNIVPIGMGGVLGSLSVSSHNEEKATPKMEMNSSTAEEGIKAVKAALKILEEEQLLLRE